ncbi:unnamed protein product [Rhizoctonia solani]|uniref:Uncharacterized protein n=1 Tax=Rhizoctonia solani TaxID=456999 RepID=A0A8H3GZF6_9AGAM|nr:unnamed protein product [Rhizoctonia solani]
MENLNWEELFKNPEFCKLASKYMKPPATESKAPGPSGGSTSGLEATIEPRVDHKDDEVRGRSRTRDTHVPSVHARNRTLSVSTSAGSEIPIESAKSKRRDSHTPPPSDPLSTKDVPPYSRGDPITQSQAFPTSPVPFSSCRRCNQEDRDYSYHRSRPTSYERTYKEHQHRSSRSSRSRSHSPRYYRNDYDRHRNRRSRPRSPRQDEYDGNHYPYRSKRLDSTRNNYDKYERHHCPRKHSQSPRREQTPPRHAETKPRKLSEEPLSPPHGWNDQGYYKSAPSSYETGGKDGDRAGRKRGGPVMVYDKGGKRVKYRTFLEKMSKEDKYFFIKEHGHPFAAVAGIPYFNPYGKVPLEDALTAIIPRAAGPLFISSGQRLDFPEYLEGRAVTRAAVASNIPTNATIQPGKFLTWAHYGPSVRLKVYNYVYGIKPYIYHFRDKTGENNWLIDFEAQEYLKEVGGYLKKSGQQTADPVDYLRQHASKNLKNKDIQKSYIEEPDAENPYYFFKSRSDKKYSGSSHASKLSITRTVTASSSTKERDARRADRIVAQEEARAKDEARALKPGKPAPVKGAANTGSVKIKTETKFKRRVESDEDSDDEPAPPKRQRKQEASESEEEFEEPEQLVKGLAKKANEAKSKQMEPDEEEETSGEEVPVRVKSRKQNTSSPKSNRKIALSGMEEPEDGTMTAARNPYKDLPDKPKKAIMSIQERARKKMRPPPEPEPQPQPQPPEDALHSKQVALIRNTKEPEKDSSLISEDPASADYQPTIDGIRIVKTTRMVIKTPTTSSVASRTRQKTAAE